MEPEQIPHPHELWWSAVVLAALHRLTGRPGCRFEPRTHTVTLTLPSALAPGGAWLRLQRARGERYVLWGRSDLAPPTPRDARREAPDWALGPATDGDRPTFVAWWAHDEWDVSVEPDEGIPQLLRPLLTVDPRLADLAAAGRLVGSDLAAAAEPEDRSVAAALQIVAQAAAPPALLPRGSAGSRLRDQVHGQMRESLEADRMLLRQPPELVRWAQVHAPGGSLQHAVMVVRGDLRPAVTNTALSRAARRALTAVLAELYVRESTQERGAWIFARVTGDGAVVQLDRAFDHWPSWWRTAHPGQGPTLADLAWEMDQRDAAWRPGWAALLPLVV